MAFEPQGRPRPKLEPPPADVSVPDEARETLPSGLDSRGPLFEGEHPQPHLQAGVSPGNAEAEDEDWDHPYAG